MALSAKREAFCREYLVDCNGTQAAIRAGYSSRTAQEQASRLLSNAMVQGRLAELRAEQQARLQMTADDIARGLYREATLTGKGSTHSARVAAWSWLGKMQGAFVDRHQHEGAGGGPVQFVEVVAPHADEEDGPGGEDG